MGTDDKYNGWANRETWAVALHINNDQGWQESVHEHLESARESERMDHHRDLPAWKAGDVIRENVEAELDYDEAIGNLWNDADALASTFRAQCMVRDDVGSLWRVDWTELGAAFLSDLGEL